MLTSSVSRASGRRGIVLVLVLAMLGLLALVGITFATYAGQSKINNRIFMQSLFQPQADELIDFGLAQLITDTNDIRSAIRGHSLAHDMYGNDATGNSLLSTSPATGMGFSITGVSAPDLSVPGLVRYTLTTSIPSNDHSFFGYDFTRWSMTVKYTGALTAPGTNMVLQSFEVLADSLYNANSTAGRTFLVNINWTDGNPLTPSPPFPLTGGGPPFVGAEAPVLQNLTVGTGIHTQLPGFYIATAGNNNSTLDTNSFSLDGRWLHAFNGPGAGQKFTLTGLPASYYGNFRFTGQNLTQPGLDPVTGGALDPSTSSMPGMDEDYDACDLENWFMAIQSADGQVIIPSFHRPAIIRYDPNNNVDDWQRLNQSNPNGGQLWADSAARILRPCQADGHDAATFTDLKPDTTTGQIKYDVDNDGDGKPDSVWVDLGYPARRDASGRLYKPLFAFMVIGLNGKIPLNTAGNLAAQVAGVLVPPDTGTTVVYGGPGHAAHLGNSISEVDPTYGLQNGFNSPTSLPGDSLAAFAIPQVGFTFGTNATVFASNSQVDNVGIDVRLTQLRNLLAGTRSLGGGNQENNFRLFTVGFGYSAQHPHAE